MYTECSFLKQGKSILQIKDTLNLTSNDTKYNMEIEISQYFMNMKTHNFEKQIYLNFGY